MDTLIITNQPICIECKYQWQKGYVLAMFDDCDNPFRIDDDEFMFVHFRTMEVFTFYSDAKGVSDKERPIYQFEEYFKL